MLVACTIGWTGAEPAFSKQAARAVYVDPKRRWLRDQEGGTTELESLDGPRYGAPHRWLQPAVSTAWQSALQVRLPS